MLLTCPVLHICCPPREKLELKINTSELERKDFNFHLSLLFIILLYFLHFP